MDQVSPTTNAQSTPQEPVKKSGNFFSIFGKIVLVLLIIGVLIFAGYYLGTSKKNSEVAVTPTPSPSAMESGTEQTNPTTEPTKAEAKTVKGGLNNGATSFKPYSVEIPEGWTEKRETTDITDKLTITKSGYSISIYQAPIGGSGCIYKGDPQSEMAQEFTNFVSISGTGVQYRRSFNKEGEYTVCQKNPNENSYGSPTQFGAISATSPSPSDQSTMTELDNIITSIKQQ